MLYEFTLIDVYNTQNPISKSSIDLHRHNVTHIRMLVIFARWNGKIHESTLHT